MADLGRIQFDLASSTPVYRQLADQIERLVDGGVLREGDKLPPTRELAGQLGLNRTTVSAAYGLLEQAGLLQGQVGRGSFIARSKPTQTAPVVVSFANSRPAESEFPLDDFRRLAKEVIDSESTADILQLGSAHGYGPLRRHLLEEAADAGVARASDGLIVTNGCQQALDLLARLHGSGTKVVLEDPTYLGAVRVFARSGAEVLAAAVDEHGIVPASLEAVLERHRPRLLVVTPSFQNPTGATLPLERRHAIVRLARQYGCTLVENDVYTELRYIGEPLPSLKQLDETGNTILLRSYSKVSFPGLRVGWIIAPRPVVSELAEVKEVSDLHSDQLSQAVLLRFAESGVLARHLQRTRKAGKERLEALLASCAEHLPDGATWTSPEGGMNLWLELPGGLEAESLLPKARQAGVVFTPGRFFSISRPHRSALRISFGGLSVSEIKRGMAVLGAVVNTELSAMRAAGADANRDMEPAAALV